MWQLCSPVLLMSHSQVDPQGSLHLLCTKNAVSFACHLIKVGQRWIVHAQCSLYCMHLGLMDARALACRCAVLARACAPGHVPAPLRVCVCVCVREYLRD